MSEWIPVLVVDDEEIMRKAIERSLKLYGFQAFTAKDGPTGLQLAEEKQPALILLDWVMPEMDGLETLAELKHNPLTEQIPVFMLTSRGIIGDLDRAFDIGADDYIIKPFGLKDLGKIVKHKWEKYTTSHTSPR